MISDKSRQINTKYAILGAGIGGLAAAWWLKKYNIHNFMVFDSNKEFTSNLHNGVHYLHSLPYLPGLKCDMKKVILSDGVLTKFGNADTAEIRDVPTLMDSLKYSKKVREVQHPSSIMEIGQRDWVWLPESNDMNQLTQQLYDEVGEESFMFGCSITDINLEDKILTIDDNGKELYVHYEHAISTLPLSMVYHQLDLKSVPVYITNCTVSGIVPDWLINLYVPSTETSIYRLSIMNNIASFESIGPMSDEEIYSIPDRFGMFNIDEKSAKGFVWNTGKVISISGDERVEAVKYLSKYDWVQIGRFGLWNRKLLMDSTIEQAKHAVNHFTEGALQEPLEVLLRD